MIKPDWMHIFPTVQWSFSLCPSCHCDMGEVGGRSGYLRRELPGSSLGLNRCQWTLICESLCYILLALINKPGIRVKHFSLGMWDKPKPDWRTFYWWKDGWTEGECLAHSYTMGPMPSHPLLSVLPKQCIGSREIGPPAEGPRRGEGPPPQS